MYRGDKLENLLKSTSNGDDPLLIVPRPTINEGSASIDLRLGTWFASLRGEKNPSLDVHPAAKSSSTTAEIGKRGQQPTESALTKCHYVPFGQDYVLHPNSFVLGVTLEWIRLNRWMGAYVVGKSSWGRRGLIIATAAGVHPGFTGCLTLELCNSGEIPIQLYPGMTICQLFFHAFSDILKTETPPADRTQFIGKRKPTLGRIEIDPIAERLSSAALK